MEDLLKRQLCDSCNLALPEGLKDLMSDICREVLRAQPENLLSFITNYLAALLVTRENLTISAQICGDVCNLQCTNELEDELKHKGFDNEKIIIIKEIVNEYFDKCNKGAVPVKEGYIISKIMRKTSLEFDLMKDIIDAVRKAFLRNQAYRTVCYELTPVSSSDDIGRAARHTLDLYRKSKPSDEEYERAATRVAAAYRAYVVRRGKQLETAAEKSHPQELYQLNRLPGDDSTYKLHDDREITIQFGVTEHKEKDRTGTTSPCTEAASQDTEESVFIYPTKLKITASSTSLAGSMMHLPALKPYTVHDEIKEVEEEKVDTLFDYTAEMDRIPEVSEDITAKDISLQSIRDYEPDDITSSVEEEIMEISERKVVIQSNILIRNNSEDELENEDFDVSENIRVDLGDDEL